MTTLEKTQVRWFFATVMVIFVSVTLIIITAKPYQINFEIDKFSADKSMTYDYNSSNNPPSWTSLPSGTPVPDPLDSKDFYVLFPHKTILPNKTQY